MDIARTFENRRPAAPAAGGRAMAAFCRLTLVAPLLGTLAAPALAKARPEASFPARAGKSILVFECGDDKAILLRIWNPVRGWRGDRASEVRIGAATFRMQIDGATDSFLLSDVSLPKMGLTDRLIAIAKSGEELVLAGAAAEQIAGPRRSYPLKGARAKIERVEKACGRVPVASRAAPGRISG